MTSLTFATLFSVALAPVAWADSLSLTVQGTTGTGTVRAAVFADQQAFDAGKTVAQTMVPAAQGQTVMSFGDLAPARYGVAVYQDLNGNEELDRNALGVPTEPYGFSNNPRIRLSAPKFAAFAFEFEGARQSLVISLNGE